MHQTQHQIYCSLVDHVAEEPVREVLKGIWSLPFVADTIESCCGHVILEQSSMQYKPLSKKPLSPDDKRWYRKNPRLGILYYLDQELTPQLVKERDQFRNDLKTVHLNSDYGILQFNQVTNHISSGDHSSGSAAGFSLPEEFRLRGQYLHESYHSTFVMEEKTKEAVLKTEQVFAQFWVDIATVIQQFNPAVEITPLIKPNFRQKIDWSNWKCTHWQAFLPEDQQAAYRRLQQQFSGF